MVRHFKTGEVLPRKEGSVQQKIETPIQTVTSVHRLHRTMGNRAVGRLVQKPEGPCLLEGSAVLFGISSSSVSGDQKETIACFARQWAFKGGDRRVMVDGYASVDGAEEYNRGLSRERALSVQQKLVEEGIPAEKITAGGHGETTAFSKDFEPNRRVVLSAPESATAPPSETPQPGQTPEPEAPGPQQVPQSATPARKVSTLCHRDFTGAVGSYVPARHCFVWGHDDSVPSSPAGIQQPDTITYDNSTSGTPDPDPLKATTCTGTFAVDPGVVKANYKRMCDPGNYNLVSFNCCTCAYMALTAAGASPSSGDFPAANQGMGLPFGGGWKKGGLETVWFNDIDEIEDVVSSLSNADIEAQSLDMKSHWIKQLISGTSCTESEGDLVVKIFRNTSASQRKTLYKMVEGHAWDGDWKNGVFVTDDDMVDALNDKQHKTVKELINE